MLEYVYLPSGLSLKEYFIRRLLITGIRVSVNAYSRELFARIIHANCSREWFAWVWNGPNTVSHV